MTVYYVRKYESDKENTRPSFLLTRSIRKENKKVRSKNSPSLKSIDSITQCLKDNMSRITYKTVECLSKSTQPHDKYVYSKLCQSLIQPVLIPNRSFDTEKQNEFINTWLQYHDLGVGNVDSFSILSEQE